VTFIDPGDPERLVAGVRAALAERFGVDADAVGRAPGRVNLIGEHTDYNDGPCLPVALPHATYVAVARRDDDVIRIASRQAEDAWSGRLDESGPGQVDGWAAYVAGVLWAMREDGHDLPGVDIVVDSTVPLGAGLSSSAAIECATAVALAALAGLDLSPELRRQLARAGMRAEAEVAGAPTGGMDQMVAMLAEPGAALLVDFGDHSVQQVRLDLADHALLVTDTRVSHELTDGGYGSRRADCDAAARELGVPTLRQASLVDLTRVTDPVRRRRAHHVVTEIERVGDAVQAVKAGDWTGLGRLFLASHASLRDDFEVSCAELDTAVVAAVGAGALGARMTGGGFGGSTVALVPRDLVQSVAAAIDDAFAAAGFPSPHHLVAVPSAAAGPV
jgi:galactokinase